jgi:hypothetical protein
MVHAELDHEHSMIEDHSHDDRHGTYATLAVIAVAVVIVVLLLALGAIG